jgi:hypothetical protein
LKKKVTKTEAHKNGTMFTYDDGTEEFLEGVTASLNKDMDASKFEVEEDDDEEKLLAGMKP